MSIRRTVPIADADWSIAPPAGWVVDREPDWNFTPAEEHGVAFLLIDQQHHTATQSAAYRVVRRPLTIAAVQALGQVEIDFDPAAQRLRIHELAMWRRAADGSWEKRSVAHRETFLIRQREQQLEQQMLDGRASVVALLEDLRVGDAIELAWTLEPRDPLPGLRFTAFFAFAWVVPVARVFFTLHLDPAQPVQWRLHAPADAVSPAHEATPETATWSLERPPVDVPEPNVPPGHWPFPVLDVSGWKDWGEVADFIAALWADALADAAETVAADATRLRVEGNPAASIGAAIRFVQEEVRYLAVDFGHGSGMLPNGAGTVLRRRFGDCKDKAVLLTALLRAFGCEAWPLLVSPGWQAAVARVQPSTAAFSHAIVTFVFEGKRYFVDPTLAGQSGDLAHLIPPPYGCGLEVRPGSSELLVLPERPPAELTLTETFHLDRKQSAGRVEQVLRASSWLADDVRAALVRGGRAAFFKARAEALQRHFSALVPAEGGEVRDDVAANVIELHAAHALPTWGPAKERPPDMFRYGAHGLFLAVEAVEGPENRRRPWALRHPMRVHHRVVVTGHCVRPTKAEKHRFSGPGFTYRCDVGSSRRTMTFDYVWETTQHEVSAQEWPAYFRERVRAFDCAGANVSTLPFLKAQRVPLMFIVPLVVVVSAFVRGIVDTGSGPSERPAPAFSERRQAEREMRSASEAMRRRDFASAGTQLEAIYRFYKDNSEYHLMRAETALQLGNHLRAESSLAEARRLRAPDAAVELLDAQLHFGRDDREGAQNILSRLIERQPGDIRALVTLAWVKEQSGDARGALEALKKALAIQPGNSDALLRFSLLAWRTGEKDEADAAMRDAIQAQAAPEALLQGTYADYLVAIGRPAEALEPAALAATLAPDDAVAAARHILILLGTERRAEALTLARKVAERFPSQPVVWGALARASATLHDRETAEKAFAEWLRLAPRNPDAHSGYGYFLYSTGRSMDARRVLEKAARDFPDNGLVWMNYGVVLEGLGERQLSVEARRKAEALLTPEQRASLIR